VRAEFEEWIEDYCNPRWKVEMFMPIRISAKQEVSNPNREGRRDDSGVAVCMNAMEIAWGWEPDELVPLDTTYARIFMAYSMANEDFLEDMYG
jgi:hypothetical protein